MPKTSTGKHKHHKYKKRLDRWIGWAERCASSQRAKWIHSITWNLQKQQHPLPVATLFHNHWMFRESHRITLFSPPCTHPRRKSKQVYKLSSNNGIKREWDSYYRARNRYTRTPQLNIFLSKNHINQILQKPNSYLQTQRHQVRTRTLPGNSSPKRRRVHATSISQEKKGPPHCLL